MVADLGTKALSSTRIQKLKEEMGMVEEEQDAREEDEAEKNREKAGGEKASSLPEDVKKALKLVVFAVQLQGARGQGRDPRDAEDMRVVWIVMVLAVLGLWSLLRWLWGQAKRSIRQPEEEPVFIGEKGVGKGQRGLRRRISEERGASGSERSVHTPRGSTGSVTPQRGSPARDPQLLEDVEDGIEKGRRTVP